LQVHDTLARHYRLLDLDLSRGTTGTSPTRKYYTRWIVVMGQLCRHGAAIVDDVSDGIATRQVGLNPQPRTPKPETRKP
jgi:hypothetical protein